VQEGDRREEEEKGDLTNESLDEDEIDRLLAEANESSDEKEDMHVCDQASNFYLLSSNDASRKFFPLAKKVGTKTVFD
jgi:hypothetical protein